MSLLDVKNLVVRYITSDGTVKSVNDVSFSLQEGECIGLVGETGAGKTTTALSIIRLLQEPPAKVESGEILFNGKNLLDLSEKEMQSVRGKEISMIFQDPMTALNPVKRVGQQIAEVVQLHEGCNKKQALAKACEMLVEVGIRPERANEFPHQFSGGMKQRVVIAMALACKPKLLLADEPTTALDVTIQAQVIEKMIELRKQYKMGLLFITHDLGVVADICDKVAIVYAGEIVEYGNLEDIYLKTTHPYTKGLFDSIPSLSKDVERLSPIPGLPPNMKRLPDGCKFAPRCPYATDECMASEPISYEVNPGHMVKCHLCRKEISVNE